jgi:hypothetical protein
MSNGSHQPSSHRFMRNISILWHDKEYVVKVIFLVKCDMSHKNICMQCIATITLREDLAMQHIAWKIFLWNVSHEEEVSEPMICNMEIFSFMTHYNNKISQAVIQG